MIARIGAGLDEQRFVAVLLTICLVAGALYGGLFGTWAALRAEPAP